MNLTTVKIENPVSLGFHIFWGMFLAQLLLGLVIFMCWFLAFGLAAGAGNF